MLTFDATSREVCTAKRESTTTPTQALVLLNDPQFVEAARVLAERVLASAAMSQNERLKFTFFAVLGRKPKDAEFTVLQRLYAEQLVLFSKDLLAAEKLLTVGEQPRNAELPVPEAAAMTMVVNTLMNHHEFVTKR